MGVSASLPRCFVSVYRRDREDGGFVKRKGGRRHFAYAQEASVWQLMVRLYLLGYVKFFAPGLDPACLSPRIVTGHLLSRLDPAVLPLAVPPTSSCSELRIGHARRTTELRVAAGQDAGCHFASTRPALGSLGDQEAHQRVLLP